VGPTFCKRGTEASIITSPFFRRGIEGVGFGLAVSQQTKTIYTLILLLTFIVFHDSAISHAQIYKCKNKAGEINFSDEICVKGEKSTRLDMQISSPTLKGHRGKDEPTAPAKKVRTDAYTLISLLSRSQIELNTASIQSVLNGQTSELPELLLSDGIAIDLLNVDKIIISHVISTDKTSMQIIMQDGYRETKIISEPFPDIIGKTRIGSFRKSLEDIRQIEFFNSHKVPIKAMKESLRIKSQSLSAHQPTKDKIEATPKRQQRKESSKVIDLDLTREIETKSTTQPIPQNIKKLPLPKKNFNMAQLIFIDDRQIEIEKRSIGSSREGHQTQTAHFILNAQDKIPFNEIKSIKVRPNKDKSQLVVAVSLKSGEIKMENMAKPFTRIQVMSNMVTIDYSLLEIKSISF